MATRNTEKRAKAKAKSQAPKPVETKETKGRGIFNYFRFSESYTSLILGIIVVIISAVLLLSFAKNKNLSQIAQENPQIASQSTQRGQEDDQKVATSSAPSVQVTVTATPEPTAKPTVKPTAVPTKAPTKAPEVTKAPKAEVTKTPKATVAPTAVPVQVVKNAPKDLPSTYKVASGDNLWNIAEKLYKSGYNWVDIARANNLSNASIIHNGDVLKIPQVAPKVLAKETTKETTKTSTNTNIDQSNKITGSTYKIVKGDDLWNIAVRAYGDGYKWVEIARANNLSNPNIIHVDNTLKLPRGK